MPLKPETRFTAEEYLERERQAEIKSEYFDGRIFAMTGASRNHNLVSGNLYARIHDQLRNTECEVYANDMRVKIESTDLYTYPDIVALCAPPEFDDSRNDTLLNPSLIIEVLSDSTEAYDRGAKFEHYRSIPSLSEYVLVSQKKCHVEKFSRGDGNTWIFSEYKRPEDELILDAVECRIKLSEIYEKIDFS